MELTFLTTYNIFASFISERKPHHNYFFICFISRKGTSLLEHPLLKEYLKAYDAVVGFKEAMSKMFLDKG